MAEIAPGIVLDEQTSMVSMGIEVFQDLVKKIPDKDCCLYRITHCGDGTRWQDISYHVLAKDPSDAYRIFTEKFFVGREDNVDITFENGAEKILR